MKAKKTLRKLSPLQRDLAKLQRAAHSVESRFDRLVEWAGEIEQEGRTLRRENAELRGKLALAEHPEQPQPELWPDCLDDAANDALLNDTLGCDRR